MRITTLQEQPFVPSAVSPSDANTSPRSPLISRLNFVSRAPNLLQYAQRWLNALRHPQPPEDIEMAEMLAAGRDYRLAAEELLALRQQAEEALPRPSSYRAGWILAIISVAATVGTLSYGLSRTRSSSADNRQPRGNKTVSRPDFALPRAEARIDENLPSTIPIGVMLPATTSTEDATRLSSMMDPVMLQQLIRAREALLKRFPGMSRSSMARKLLAPLLIMLSGSRQAPPLSVEQQQARWQQLLLMINALLPGLTTAEQLALYGKGTDDIATDRRFIVRHGQVYVEIERQRYLLRLTSDNAPFVAVSAGEYRFIQFNQRSMCWDFISDRQSQHYFASRYQYKAGGHPLRLTADTDSRINNDYDMVTLNVAGQPAITGVLLGGDFIPVWWDGSDESIVYSQPASGEAPELLIHGDYGWVFEQPSVLTDPYLNLLLQNQRYATQDPAQHRIGAIGDTDGLSFGYYGESFLKLDNNYYRVDDVYDAQRENYGLGLTAYPDSLIVFRDGIMNLLRAGEMIFSLDIETVSNSLISGSSLRIESDALRYLRENAAIADAEVVTKLEPTGLYLDRRLNSVLVLGDKKYAVRHYTAHSVSLISNSRAGKEDIVLWLNEGVWWRVREPGVSVADGYTRLQIYDNLALAGEKPGTIAFMVETELHQCLQHHGLHNTSVNSLPTAGKIYPFNDFSVPLFYHDRHTGNNFLVYNGSFFHAKFIDTTANENLSDLLCIEISGKTDGFYQQPVIATIVLEENNAGLTLKTIEAWLAEKLNISKAVAGAYLANSPWRSVTAMREIEPLVSRLAFSEAPLLTASELNFRRQVASNTAAQPAAAIQDLYPVEGGNKNIELANFTVIPLSAGIGRVPQQIKKMLEHIKENLLSALDNVEMDDRTRWPVVKDYLATALSNNSNRLLAEVTLLLGKRLHSAVQALQEKNIQLILGKNLAPVAAGKLVCFSPADGQIYIAVDKITGSDEQRQQLVGQLLQAALQLSGTTTEFYHQPDTREPQPLINDVIDNIAENIKTNRLSQAQTDSLQTLSRRYLENIPACLPFINTLLQPEKLAYLYARNSGFRAYLLLHSASSVARLVQDLHRRLVTAEVSSRITPARTLPQTTTGSSAARVPIALNHSTGNGKPAPDKLYLRLPEGERNRGDRFIPDSRDSVFLAGPRERHQDVAPWPGPTRNATTTTITKAVVLPEAVEIPELACLGEKDLTFWDWVRMAGQTLERTITENAKEWQRYYHIEVLGKDCPSPEDVKRLTDITEPIDAVINLVLSLVPSFMQLGILKNLVGPALQVFADDMQGKSVNVEERKNLIQQTLQMVRQEIPTMKTSEQAILLAKPGAKKGAAEGADMLKKRFNIVDGTVHVNIDKQMYPLKEMPDTTPYIIDTNSRTRFIRFNQQKNKWEQVNEADNVPYSEESKENIQEYSQSLSQEEDNDYTFYPVERDFIEVKSATLTPPLRGVFIGQDFIPATWFEGKRGPLYYSLSGASKEKRVLVKTPYGWEFERASVPTDKYLDIILRRSGNGEAYTAGKAIYPIDPVTGISFSGDGKTLFIKRYNKYHPVTPHGSSGYYSLNNASNTLIKYNNGFFSLVSDDNALLLLRNKEVTGKYEMDKPDRFRIEASALDYLHEHGKPSELIPAGRVFPGLYAGRSGGEVFMVNDKRFTVSYHRGNIIHIKNKSDAADAKNIMLWRDEDTWIRVRDQPEEDTTANYKELSYCRITRAPESGSWCRTVVIEKNLHEKLKQAINAGRTSQLVPKIELMVADNSLGIPFMYRDKTTGKYYFHYEKAWFNTKLVQADDGDNPTRLLGVKLYGRRFFFSNDIQLATILTQQKNNRLEIKQQITFLSELLNSNSEMTEIYTHNRRYREIAKIDIVEDLVSGMRAAGKMFVEIPDETPVERPLEPELKARRRYIRDILFPYRITSNPDYDIKFIKIDQSASLLPIPQQEAVEYIKQIFTYLKEKIIPAVTSALYPDDYHWPDAEDYFMKVLKSNSYEFHVNVALALRKRLKLINLALSAHRIYVVTAISRSGNGDSSGSLLTQEERNSGEAVFISPYRDGNIFINIDKVAIEDSAVDAPLLDPIQALLRTLFDGRGMTINFFDIEKVNGLYVPVMDSIDAMTEIMRLRQLSPQQDDKLQEVSKIYLEKIPAYQENIGLLMNGERISYLFENDNAFRAHLLLNSPDYLSLFTQDIYYRLRMSEYNMDGFKLDAWFNNYGARRGVSLEARYESMRIGSVSTTTIEVSSLVDIKISELNTVKIPGLAGIYSTIAGVDKLIKLDDKFYPVEFLGKDKRVVLIGSRTELRQTYYYNSGTGAIKPIQKASIGAHRLNYYRDVDLYESVNIEDGKTAILKYSIEKDELIKTGAKKIIRMPNKVHKIEFERFDLFIPAKPSTDVYFNAHGLRQITTASKIPKNVDVHFYTEKGTVLWGYYNDIYDLVRGAFPIKETRKGGESVESYIVEYDHDESVNYHALAQKSQKNLVRATHEGTSSTREITEALAKLFSNKKIDIHFYICRTIF